MRIAYIVLFISTIFLLGCVKPMELNTYIPPKEKIIYKSTSTSSSTDSIREEYVSNLRPEFNFQQSDINVDSFALIIGINEYALNAPVKYADMSALAFEELAMKTFGVPKENIILLINAQATSGQLKAKISLIKELVERNGNLYLYFAGHGVPGVDGSTYILPSDMSADSIHLEQNLKLDSIYETLAESEAKNIFVFIDSCFSGKDDKGDLLYRGVAPVLKVEKNVVPNDKITVMTAGESNNFANDYEPKKQRLFSYYLIKELSAGEKNLENIYESVRSKVRRASLMKGIGYRQIPQIYGNGTAMLY